MPDPEITDLYRLVMTDDEAQLVTLGCALMLGIAQGDPFQGIGPAIELQQMRETFGHDPFCELQRGLIRKLRRLQDARHEASCTDPDCEYRKVRATQNDEAIEL